MTVGILLAVLFGTIALLRLPIQMIPTVDRPEITVETDYRGAAPLEVEREVTDRLEEKLNAVEHLPAGGEAQRGRTPQAGLVHLYRREVHGRSQVRLGHQQGLPRGNRNFIFGFVKTPPGFNTDQKEEIIKVIESRFRAIPEIESMFAVVRVDAPIMGAIVKEPHTDLEGMRRVVAAMRRAVGGIPGTQAVFITQAGLFPQRGPSSAATTWPWTSRETICSPSGRSPRASRGGFAACRA